MRIYSFSLLCIFFLCASPLLGGILVLGDLKYEYNTSPGDSVKGSIEVVNQEEGEEQQVRIYQTDYSYQADGKKSYGEPGKMARSNTSWIEISPRQFVLSPGERMSVNFVVRVPVIIQDGTYWSMIMVEPVSEINPDESENGFQLLTVFRYAIQMITNIGNSSRPSLTFNNTQLIRNEAGRILQVDIENDGNQIARPEIWVEFYDTQGQFKGKFLGKKGKLFPGTSIRSEMDVTDLAPGEYKAMIVADCGGDDIFGMNVNLKVEDVQPAEKQ